MRPVKEIRFFATNADLGNLRVLRRRWFPNDSESFIIGEGLRALREKLESQPAREPLIEPAEQSIKDLFGE